MDVTFKLPCCPAHCQSRAVFHGSARHFASGVAHPGERDHNENVQRSNVTFTLNLATVVIKEQAMNFVTRFLTAMVVEHHAVPRPAQAAVPAPNPYGHRGRLVCAPWEGLYLDEAS